MPDRQPYVGDLVFTAFSGSHQDAIKKGMADIYDVQPGEPLEACKLHHSRLFYCLLKILYCSYLMFLQLYYRSVAVFGL